MEKLPSYIVLLLICILSRLLSSVSYIEDFESLRVITTIYEGLRSPGSAVLFTDHILFNSAAELLYLIIGDASVVFSVIGGVSVFFIIIYLLKLINVPLLSLEGVLTSIFLFFNPMIWIMSNRYLPDLAGTAVALASFYYLVPETYKKRDLYNGWFLAGLLGGIKLSFMPFLIIPLIYAFIVKKNYLPSIGLLVAGVLLWMVPSILLLGWDEYISLVQSGFKTYFSSGTLFTEHNAGERLWDLIQSVWADGIGGYWADRNPALIINSLGFLACLIFGVLILFNFGLNPVKAGILMLSVFTYAVWIYFFENLKSSDNPVILIIPFCAVLLSYGIIYFLVNFNFLYIKVLTLAFILGNVFLTVVLAVHHTYPTAVAQLREYIINKKEADEKITIIADSSFCDFFAVQSIRANYIIVPGDSLFTAALKLDKERSRILLVGDFSKFKNRKNIIHFSHNPYINRSCPNIDLYEYDQK